MVNLSLNKKTSLAGTRLKYESGKYSKKDLYNYLKALRVAGSDSLFKSLAKEYMAMMEEKEYAQPENWIFAHLHKNRQGAYYRYMVANKPLFIKNVGEKQVNWLSYLFVQFGDIELRHRQHRIRCGSTQPPARRNARSGIARHLCL